MTTDLIIEVFPEGPEAATVTATAPPVADTVAELPRPTAATADAAPAPLVAAVTPVVRNIVATPSGGQGLTLIVHPHP